MTSEKTTATNDGVLLTVHFDVGHASIGWAVMQDTDPVVLQGCGTVLFEKDGCLASDRRMNRRQKRHVRSTRQRIQRMRLLLSHLCVMSDEELKRPGIAAPWKLAAEVLACGSKLTWPQLWDVLRWYAHNRGYDDNALWKRGEENETETQDEKDTRESLQNARELMRKHGTKSMAETVCAVLGLTPGEKKSSSQVRFKAAKASFDRHIVRNEVQRILEAHKPHLPALDDALIRVLIGDPITDPEAWHAISCPSIKVPKRYRGGILFGQLVPRFDNRIIGTCPVDGAKRPLKSCPEFLEYRWAMQLANVRVRRPGESELGPLTPEERKTITETLRKDGYFTRTTFKEAVNAATNCTDSNLHDLLLHPDAEKALVLYPALREAKASQTLGKVWDFLPQPLQRKALHHLKRGKTIRLADLRNELDDTASFDAALKTLRKRNSKKDEDPLAITIKATYPSGRAPYSRATMRKAVQEVMEGKDPRSEGGILYGTAETPSLPEEEIDQQTNNHMVRHRIRILRRLMEEIIAVYAGGDKTMIDRITVEVNREVKDLSGKASKQIAAELGLRLKSHKQAVEYAAKALGIPAHKLGGALIRKVRIAQDLDWTCPYTGAKYDIFQLRSGEVDLDHIIPKSKRNTDSLDSLVITFKAVNAWKSNATALQFIMECGGKTVPGMPRLSILTETNYRELVASLGKKRMPHASRKSERKTDDEIRRDLRCKRLLTLHVDPRKQKEFTPGDLTRTSHLIKLGIAALRDLFNDSPAQPIITPLPGRVTKEVRIGFQEKGPKVRNWNILGALATVNPLVLNSEGELKTKTEIRDISHLHHAVDAVTLGLAAHLVPRDGAIQALFIKGRLTDAERARLEKTGRFVFDSEGRPSLPPLHPQTRASIERCLAECRVATHLSKSKSGLSLEKTVWRLLRQEGEWAYIRQQSRDEKTGKISIKGREIKAKRLLGVAPRGQSKLKAIKGVMIISDNYGVALDPEPEVIPFHQVWRRIGEIKRKNGGKMPRILRNGMLIRINKGRYRGQWKVISIKDGAKEIKLDFLQPDMTAAADGTNLSRREVSLKTLLNDGLEILPFRYTGVPRDVAPSD